ncbi:MAG: hypothetical protein IJ659_04540 [Alloprevotella sp.]|nr:hypothetical protein [Alloprevotella sp.]
MKLEMNSSVMLSISGTEVGGSGDTGPGQLTREYGGWSSENWSDVEDEEEY